MRYSGTLAQWNDERGFGWIEADEGGGERLFVHISAFQTRPVANQRPQAGQRLAFDIGVERGKKRALNVAAATASAASAATAAAVAGRSANAGNASRGSFASRSAAQAYNKKPERQRRTSSAGAPVSSQFSYGAVLLWLVLMGMAAVLWGVPKVLWLLYAGLSVVTFMVYWQDKWAAQKGQWRTPEKTLQGLALFGGWPGAVLAQQWLRHKSSKTSFQIEFWLMVVINVGAVLWLCSPYGRGVLKAFG